MAEGQEYEKRIGTAIIGLYDELLVKRNASCWSEKLEACSYLHHRDSYYGTTVRKRVTYDSTPKNAFSIYRDGMVGYVLPQDEKWFQMVPGGIVEGKDGRKEFYANFSEADRSGSVMRIMDRLTDMTLMAMGRSNFYEQFKDCFSDGSILGDGYMKPVYDRNAAKKLRYETYDPQEVVASLDENQDVDVFIRNYKMDAKSVVSKWDECRRNEQLLNLARMNVGEKDLIEIYEAYMPRGYIYDFDANEPFRIGIAGKRYAHLVWIKNYSILAVNEGTDMMPCVYIPDNDNNASAYGKGIVIDKMDDIIRLDDYGNNAMRMAQRAGNPPMNVHITDRDKFSIRPGTQNFYTDSSMLPSPTLTGEKADVLLASQSDLRQQIMTAFNADFFLAVMQSRDSRKTAYEVSQMQMESKTLLVIKITRLSNTLIFPIIKNTMKLLLQEMKEQYGFTLSSGGNADLISDIDDMMKLVDSSKIMLNSTFVRVLEQYMNAQGLTAGLSFIANGAQIAPETLLNFKLDEIMRAGAVGSGLPYHYLQDYATVQKQKQAMAEKQAQQTDAEINVENAKANEQNAKAISQIYGGRA